MKKLIIIIACTMILVLFAACAAPSVKPSDVSQATVAPTVEPTASQPVPSITNAPVEHTSQAVAGSDPIVLRKLNYMMPVFDSIARGTGSENGAYNPTDNEYFWTVLYLCGVNWGLANQLVEYDENTVKVPRQAMQEYASAAFYEYDDLPLIPENLSGSAITYDEALDSYMLAASDMGDTASRLDGYFVEADGSITAKVGVYSFEEGLVSTVTFGLADNAYASGITDATYYYSVKSVSIESADTKLWQAFSGDQAEYTAADGMNVKINITGDEDAYSTTVDFEVNGAKQQQFIDCFLSNMSCHISDPDDTDGCIDIYISGDTASDDYSTFIYRINAAGISMNELYGSVEALNSAGDALVSTNVDVLGTYGAMTVYTRTSNLSFERISDYELTGASDMLICMPLTLQSDGFDVIIEHADGSISDEVLNAGVKLIPYQTDAESYCRLLLEDGRRAYIDITPDTENWGWIINGVSEGDWFGEIPYCG